MVGLGGVPPFLPSHLLHLVPPQACELQLQGGFLRDALRGNKPAHKAICSRGEGWGVGMGGWGDSQGRGGGKGGGYRLRVRETRRSKVHGHDWRACPKAVIESTGAQRGCGHAAYECRTATLLAVQGRLKNLKTI